VHVHGLIFKKCLFSFGGPVGPSSAILHEKWVAGGGQKNEKSSFLAALPRIGQGMCHRRKQPSSCCKEVVTNDYVRDILSPATDLCWRTPTLQSLKNRKSTSQRICSGPHPDHRPGWVVLHTRLWDLYSSCSPNMRQLMASVWMLVAWMADHVGDEGS
jgi:hypothetical protein